MRYDGCIWAQSAQSDRQAYLKETLTEQSFCVAMLCVVVSPRPSKREVMPQSSREVELKTLLCVKTRATAPVRQSALRSQTSPFTSVILTKSAQRCINRMIHEEHWHICFFWACILSYVRVALELPYIRNLTQRLCPRVQCAALLREVWGRVRMMQRWLTGLSTTHSCCSRLHVDVIDQLELGALAFKTDSAVID